MWGNREQWGAEKGMGCGRQEEGLTLERSMDSSVLIVGCSGSSAGGLVGVVMAQHFIFS